MPLSRNLKATTPIVKIYFNFKLCIQSGAPAYHISGLKFLTTQMPLFLLYNFPSSLESNFQYKLLYT